MTPCQTCYLDNQKSEWKQQKLQSARDEAKSKAKQTGETVAIIKQPIGYITIVLSKLAGETVVEYVSKDC